MTFRISSSTLNLIIEQFVGNTCFEYNSDVIKTIAKLELIYADSIIDAYMTRKLSPSVPLFYLLKHFNVFEKSTNLFSFLYEYTKDAKYKPIETLSTPLIEQVVSYDSYNFDRIACECEVALMNIIYGVKQCEYVIELINRVSSAGSNANPADLIKYMSDIFDSEFKNLNQRFLLEAIRDINPQRCALNTWLSLK